MSLDIKDAKFIVYEAKGLSSLATELDEEERMNYLIELVVNEIKKRALLGFSSLTVGTNIKCTINAKVGSKTGDFENPHVVFRKDFINNMREIGCDCSNSMHPDDDAVTIWW